MKARDGVEVFHMIHALRGKAVNEAVNEFSPCDRRVTNIQNNPVLPSKETNYHSFHFEISQKQNSSFFGKILGKIERKNHNLNNLHHDQSAGKN